jgi:hypothetical protein
MKLFVSFLKYQKDRFPLAILIPTMVTSVLGAAQIFGVHSFSRILLLLIAALAFLFHIRVIDEIRDFEHDSTFHSYRPVQQGIITLDDLRILRVLVLAVFLGICFLYSWTALIFAGILFAYSYIAAKDFFIPSKIRKHFFLYNFLNMLQLIGLQIVLYILLGWSLIFSPVLVAHLALIFIISLILEVLRKIKLTKHETGARDTYSAHLGYKGSILFFVMVSVLPLFPLYYILEMYSKNLFICIPIAVFFVLIFFASEHSKKEHESSEKLLFLASLLYYCVINLTILAI